MSFTKFGAGRWEAGQGLPPWHRAGKCKHTERRSFYETYDDAMEDISDREAYQDDYFKDLPPTVEGSNHFIPFELPRPIDIPPYEDFLLRGLKYATYRPVCREILRRKHSPDVFRQMLPRLIRPWDGPPSLPMSMRLIAKKCDRHHRELIAYMQGQRIRGPVVKPPPPQEPEKEDVDSDEIDVILRAIKRPRTRLATGTLIRKAARDPYPTPPATSEDENDDDCESPGSGDDKGEEEEEEEEEEAEQENEEEEDDDGEGLVKNPKRIRRKGHVQGINRKTGEKTLVGRYPPRMDDQGNYHCPLAECFTKHRKCTWGTKNGYKYHLVHVCLQNPDRKTKQSGTMPQKAAVLAQREDCGKGFRSESGFRKHRKKNETVKNGQCGEKPKAGQSGGSVVPE